MFSQEDRRECPAVPREAFLHVRSLCSTGYFSEAIGVLDQSCSLQSPNEWEVRILWHLGNTALEERDYQLAYHAHQVAYDRALRVTHFGPTELLSLLCDAAELNTLAFPQSKFIGSSYVRTTLEDAVVRALTTSNSAISPDLMCKMIMAAGEVGSTQQILDTVEDFCLGRYSQHLNSAATEGLLELLLGHEYVRQERMQGMRLLCDAQEAYLNSYRKLRGFSEYCQLQPYALLCAARVAGLMRDNSGEELYLTECAHEFVQLAPVSRSLASSARVLDAIANHAVLTPHFRSLFEVVFERVELPVHHLVAGLALWNRPYCVNSRLKYAESLEQQEEVIEDTRKMIDRAEELARDIIGISNTDRVLLSVSRVHMALRDGDEERALATLHEGLRITAVDPRSLDLIFPFLVEVAWDWEHSEHADQLCSMFEELIELAPRSDAYDEEVADLKCQLVVGLANSLPHIACSDERKAHTLARAVENLTKHLMRKRDSSVDEIRVFSNILERGVNLATLSSLSTECGNLLLALRELYEESFRRRERIEAADIDWLREALRVERNALVIFQALGEVGGSATCSERVAEINQEIENRIRAGEEEGAADEEDLLDDGPAF